MSDTTREQRARASVKFPECTAELCERRAECTTCRRPKHPLGRDPGVAAANGYCARECPGRLQDPLPGHLWPGELARLRQGDDDADHD